MIITSPTHTSFQTRSIGFSPEPPATELVYKSWLLLSLTCRKKFAARNPDRLMVFTAESQFWCLSDTALGLVLQSDSPLAAPLSFF